MARPPAAPLLSFDQPLTGARSPMAIEEPDAPKRRWLQRIPVVFTFLLVLSPHPSLLILLVRHFLVLRPSLTLFLAHLGALYALTFVTLTSLLVCVARDPGPVGFEEAIAADSSRRSEDLSLAEALMAPADESDFNAPGKWCKACWAPKPERTHHCRHCGRCVLRMDHHCPWLGTCVGHRTYAAFVHFLGAVTLFAVYVGALGASALWWSFEHVADVVRGTLPAWVPGSLDDSLAVHELVLTGMGCIFSVVIGSFYVYHLYLITTNQTTLEHISPFLLLRHLPPLPPPASGQKLSSPPDEDELSYAQRSLVRSAHGQLRVYDVGWRRNWAAVYGWDGEARPWAWVCRLVYGGGCSGDGRHFPRNPRAEQMLTRLAEEIVSADKSA